MSQLLETRVTEGGVVVVTARGELTLVEAPEIRRALHALADGGHTLFVLDLTASPYIDSAVLGLLIGLYRRVWLAGAAPVVQKTFQLTGMSKLFPMTDTADEALGKILAP